MDIFETDRLILRRWNEGDAEDFHTIDGNPNVAVPVGWGVRKDAVKSRKFLDILIKKDTEWAVVLKQSSKVIGCVGYNYDTMRKGSVSARNIIYALNEDYWGQGYCSEAVKRLMKHLFEEQNIEVLCGHFYSYNSRSKKVLESCGFTYEGTLRMFEKKKEETIDYIWYSILSDEYKNIIKSF